MAKVYNPTDAPVTLQSGVVVGGREHADIKAGDVEPPLVRVRSRTSTPKKSTSSSTDKGDESPKES